ncbi:MAG: DoxX-like family protein [Opitutales bacterium]
MSGYRIMKARQLHWILNCLVAAVWMINGLFAKVLDFAPRHEQIVAEILGAAHAGWLTNVIGAGEILIALWVMSGLFPRISATVQIRMLDLLVELAVPFSCVWVGTLHQIPIF